MSEPTLYDEIHDSVLSAGGLMNDTIREVVVMEVLGQVLVETFNLPADEWWDGVAPNPTQGLGLRVLRASQAAGLTVEGGSPR